MAITIKEPCHEDWSKMTPTQRGAFCQVCTKEVIDFTSKSPIEIKSIFAKEFAENRTPCARITNYQMDQINDDFFKWKKDSDAFRAVWIFSLIAVFGFTLFSCSNTHSRELVDQLNIETNVMLDSLTQKDSLVAQLPNDSSQLTQFTDTTNYVIHPWIYTEVSGGVTPYYPQIIGNINWEITDSIWVIMTSGMVHVPEDSVEEVEEFLASDASPFTNPLPPVTLPVLPTPPQPAPAPTSPKLLAVTSSGDKKFSAFVYPNPIVPSSRLYIDVHEYVDLTISVFQKPHQQAIQAGNSDFGFGHYVVDPKLYDLNHGEYQLRLEDRGQITVLDFFV